MSDPAKQPPKGPAQSQPPRATTSPGMPRVMNAARAAPQPEEQLPLKERLVKEGSNLALNLVAMGREAVEDFRQRDKYFKYKALIASTWFVLSATSIGIACPGSSLKTTDLGARVVVGKTTGRPSVVIHNESKEEWTEVRFVVNRDYSAFVERVKPGDYVTLTPKQLLGPGGKSAPADLTFLDLELRTGDGTDVLLTAGKME